MSFIYRIFLYLSIILVCKTSIEIQNLKEAQDKATVEANTLQQKSHINSLLLRIQNEEFNKSTWQLTDEVITLGKKYNMPKAVVTASLKRCGYIWQNSSVKDTKRVEQEIYGMMSYAMQHKFVREYFFEWNCLCNFYLATKQYRKGYSEIVSFYQSARKYHEPLFIGWSKMLMADAYRNQLRNTPAIEQYLNAAEYCKKTRDYTGADYSYQMAAAVHIRMKNFDDAISLLQQDIAFIDNHHGNWSNSRLRINGMLGICYYYKEEYDKMRQMFGEIQKIATHTDIFDKWIYRRLKAHCLIAEEKYEPANLLIDSISFPVSRYQLRDEILRKQNKFKEATQNLRELVMFKKNTIVNAEKSYDMIKKIQMSLANNELRNKSLKARHDRLSLNAVVSLATLRHHELENMNLHQRMKMIARQQESQAAHRRLMYEHQRQIAVQREMMDEQHLSHIRSKVIIVTLCTSAFLIVFFILYNKRRKKYIARLTILEQSTAESLREAEVLHHEAQTLLNKAEEADKLKSHFIQNISYGVRTSLNAIVGFSGLISNDSEKVDKNAEKYFTSLVEHESTKLTSFINDILDIANLTTGKYKMQYNAVTLPELCDSALFFAAGHAKESVDTRAQYADVLSDLVVYLDVQRINQVLQKLLDNACKFTEKGTIYLSCAVTGEKIVFCVTDTGMGIPEDKSEIIFNRFVKLNEFMPGFGLGLSICKAVAERVNGRVWHDTNYKSGARFYFEMPLTTQPPQEGGEQ